ncbi:TonB-dependent receptor [Allopontixanthobacter sp.]|uniref:TonB-dependent receptor n=1 Tax=Allopontixanthobacter sp. TaxID=2906452 RepID=UPI002ABA42AE|nr:TonB-dependent receptor [Allopontixanthobacter sp.]MDZ4307051.1 TonB-dependent receptor [Allopontixanthobacter sp.]
MNIRFLLSSCACAALTVAVPALAQEGDPVGQVLGEQPDEEPDYDGSLLDEIVVTADRIRGQVDTAQAPIVELNEADIGAYGASSIADLVEALGTVTQSSRGRGGGQPVFLINGIRVGSFREFRSYPPESIRKVEVLPEEVAQKFGFAPDRRVINFILKDNYTAVTAEAEYAQPARGRFSRNEQEVTLLKIANGARINVNLEATDRSLLTEAERGVEQTPSSVSLVSGDPAQADFRSLVSDTFSFEGTANYARSFADSGASLGLNGTYERNESRSLSGLNSVLLTDPLGNRALRTFGADNPLEQRTSSDTGSASVSYNRPVGAFQLTTTADAGLTNSTTQIDLRPDISGLVEQAADGSLALDAPLPGLADPGFAVVTTNTKNASSKATLQGAALLLPAGEVNLTFDLGYNWNDIEGADSRTNIETDLTRGNLNGGVNVSIPVTSTRDNFLGAVGDISLNVAGGFDRLSDFGTLYDWTASVTWAPFEQLDLTATYVNRESPPSLSQLGSPEVVTFNVSTFDFVRGETVLATITSGGNPFLIAETQKDWNFSANWKVPFIENANLEASFIRNRSDDVSSAFPTLTSEIEAAFPDRVTRGADGTLLAVDRRPVTYSQTLLDRLALGLSLRGNFGEARVPEGRAEGGRRGAPGAAGGRRGRRGGGGPGGFPGTPGGGDDGRGRFFVSLNHTLDFKNEILIAPGVPVIDLIGGGGAVSRNNTRLEAGMFRGGLGLRLSGSYLGPTRIDGSDALGSSDLEFDGLAKVDLRFFADLGEVLKKQDGPLKGLRIALRADNLFDGVRRVTDEDGNVPLNYQPALIDPVGRYLGIDVRKMF